MCLVTLVDPFFFTKAPQLMEEAKKNALESVKGEAKLLTDGGWAVQFDVILDNPRHGLPRAAGAWKADLILLGSHGRSAVQRLLVGRRRVRFCGMPHVRWKLSDARAKRRPQAVAG